MIDFAIEAILLMRYEVSVFRGWLPVRYVVSFFVYLCASSHNLPGFEI